MRAIIIFSFLLAAWGLMVLLPGTSLAEEASDHPRPEDKFPRLGEHRFIPNNLTSDPFIRTYVRNSLGMGKAVDLYIPVLEIDGIPVVGLKGDLMNAILEFEYQQAVKDWVAFLAQIRVFGRLGTGTEALLAQGVTASIGYEFGWMFRLSEGDKTALSGTLNIWNTNSTIVDLLGYVNGVIDGTNEPLVRKTPLTRGGAGLRYAWAASELVGFNFSGETGLGESIDRSEAEKFFFQLGVAADFDLKAKTSVPLGIVLAYQGDTFPEGGEDLADFLNKFLLRVAFTGTTDFLISLDFSYAWYKPEITGEVVKLASTLVNLRYYF